MKRLSRQPLFPRRTFKSMEEILFCLFSRIFHGSIHFYEFKKKRLDFKEWNWLVSWKTRIEDLFGGRGEGVFLLIEQWTCILSGWNLTLILDPRSRFSRKPKDLLFEEVTIRSISTEGWLTMHMLWSTSSVLYIPRDNFMIYNVKTLKVYLLIYFFSTYLFIIQHLDWSVTVVAVPRAWMIVEPSRRKWTALPRISTV